jgi:hypothetical protein
MRAIEILLDLTVASFLRHTTRCSGPNYYGAMSEPPNRPFCNFGRAQAFLLYVDVSALSATVFAKTMYVNQGGRGLLQEMRWLKF